MTQPISDCRVTDCGVFPLRTMTVNGFAPPRAGSEPKTRATFHSHRTHHRLFSSTLHAHWRRHGTISRKRKTCVSSAEKCTWDEERERALTRFKPRVISVLFWDFLELDLIGTEENTRLVMEGGVVVAAPTEPGFSASRGLAPR